MKELVVISGKGGTGKTSITASFAVLAENPVVADCDVDAADLHLVLAPQIKERYEFRSGREAIIRQEACSSCAKCVTLCRFEAIKIEGKIDSKDNYFVDPLSCEGCGVCVRFCPEQAIDFKERVCGEWMISETRCGPMVHASLRIAAENSGKLVSTVRKEARRIAEEQRSQLIIVDGPPGIGCPVIASLSGATFALVVTEPTVSGEHDLQRVLSLTNHFKILAAVCVNKWDLNPEMTKRIEAMADKMGASVAGRIAYDKTVTSAQIEEKAVVEKESLAGKDIAALWREIKQKANI